MPITCYIALGANLSNREKNIRAAAAQLSSTPGVSCLRLSSLIENPAVGGPPHSPPFLNAVAEVQTTLPPHPLLDRLLQIESALGRTRRHRWEPRVIDLDLLLYGELIIDEPGLTLPHPRMHQRRFVLAPLAELSPNLLLPRLAKTAQTLLDELPPAP